MWEEDLGGREPPLSERGLSPSKPPSLTENFPQEHPPFHGKELFRFAWRGCFWGKFFGWIGRREFFAECGFALFWWAGEQGSVNIARAEIDPPSSVAVATASPEGKPSRNPFGFHNEINKVRRSRSFCVWGAVGYNALHERRSLYCRERPMCRSVSIERNLS